MVVVVAGGGGDVAVAMLDVVVTAIVVDVLTVVSPGAHAGKAIRTHIAATLRIRDLISPR